MAEDKIAEVKNTTQAEYAHNCTEILRLQERNKELKTILATLDFLEKDDAGNSSS
jgi:hypothetical protein